MSNEHLLIIDDNHSLITILERLLLPLGYQVSQALDGPQGLAMALDLKPDLLLLDMYMPHMTGLQLLRQLREKQFAAPVIFMTAQSSETIVIEAFRLGVTDYLIKPFQVDDLLRTVDNALLSTRLNQEKEQLTRALEQAETVRQTVATLSHYINNSLVAASCGLDLLYEMAFQLSDTRQGERLTDIFVSSRASLERIEAVLRAMQRLNSVNLVDHESGVVTIALEDLLQSVEGETAVFSPYLYLTNRHRSGLINEPKGQRQTGLNCRRRTNHHLHPFSWFRKPGSRLHHRNGQKRRRRPGPPQPT